MDDQKPKDPNEKRFDEISEDEVRRGWKVLEVPSELQAILEADRAVDDSIPSIRVIRFTKLTAKKRRFINEAVVARWHKDLDNPSLKSQTQVKTACVARGEWSDGMERRMEELQEDTSRLATELLTVEDLDLEESVSRTLENKAELTKQFRDACDAVDAEGKPLLDDITKAEVFSRFDRWQRWSPLDQEHYDKEYAAGQNRDHYSADNDGSFLYDNASGYAAIEILSEIEDARDKLNGLRELMKKRRELLELSLKQAKMYIETPEQRREQTEEYARLYFCTESGTLDDKRNFVRKGPLTGTFEDLWSFPEEVIQYLLVEVYFFLNAIPDSAREYLTQLGFINAPRRTGSTPSSDASLEEPSSKPDLPPAEETPSGSSDSPTDTK